MIEARQYRQLAAKHGTPLYVYDKAYLKKRAQSLQNLCNKYGFLLRYAVKANPYTPIVKLFDSLGLYFDASSEYEANHLIDLGVKPAKISLSSQQPPRDIKATLNSGIKFVATSLHQLDLVAQSGWEGELAVRLNPGIGAGHSRRVTTGGKASSFGIWHEYLLEVLAWEQKSGCVINRLHIHIGSGAETETWRETIKQALELTQQMPNVTTLNVGGGYKVARMPGEKDADMAEILKVFADELDKFHAKGGRRINLEIEPGTWLVANGGCLLSKVVDIVDTGKSGFSFLRLDTGMNDLLRPTLYGAQHQITVLSDSSTRKEYVVVGHNCESGDILTPQAGNPENIAPRVLKQAKIGDLISIEGAGAYGAAMSAKGYNSFPPAQEILL